MCIARRSTRDASLLVSRVQGRWRLRLPCDAWAVLRGVAAFGVATMVALMRWAEFITEAGITESEHCETFSAFILPLSSFLVSFALTHVLSPLLSPSVLYFRL